MADLVNDFLLKSLAAWGIKRIYGFPGDGINGIMGALDRAGDMLKLVQARHEEMAAFMACAPSEFTDEVGVCLATSEPGAIHLLNGLYDAKMDHQSVWRSWDNRRARRLAASTSKRSISSRSTRMSRMSSCRWCRCPSRCAT